MAPDRGDDDDGGGGTLRGGDVAKSEDMDVREGLNVGERAESVRDGEGSRVVEECAGVAVVILYCVLECERTSEDVTSITHATFVRVTSRPNRAALL